MKKKCILFYYKKQNRYSFNAIIGALEKENFIENINFFIPSNEETLIKTIREIEKNSKKIIVVFSFFSTQLFEIKDLIKKLKKSISSKVIFLAGGPHPTGEPEDTINIGFDYVLVGEGEKIFPFYIKKILNDEEISKIGKSRKGEVNLNDFFPFPHKKFKKFGPIEITRGCPFFCNYCQTSRIFGGKVRHRSIDSICKIVEYMKKNNRLDIRFITPNALSYGSIDGKKVNLEAIENLLKEIRKLLKDRGRIFFGSFPSEVRPEQVNEEVLNILKKYVDNKNLIIGAQSGSEKILTLCNRQHTVKDVLEAVKLSKKFGFIPNIDFIFGLPGETDKDIKDTILLMKDLIKIGARIHAHTFMPLPQTPFKLSPPGKIKKDILKEFKYEIPLGLIFGNYIQQEVFAERISKYFKSISK